MVGRPRPHARERCQMVCLLHGIRGKTPQLLPHRHCQALLKRRLHGLSQRQRGLILGCGLPPDAVPALGCGPESANQGIVGGESRGGLCLGHSLGKVAVVREDGAALL